MCLCVLPKVQSEFQYLESISRTRRRSKTVIWLPSIGGNVVMGRPRLEEIMLGDTFSSSIYVLEKLASRALYIQPW